MYTLVQIHVKTLSIGESEVYASQYCSYSNRAYCVRDLWAEEMQQFAHATPFLHRHNPGQRSSSPLKQYIMVLLTQSRKIVLATH